MKNVLCSRCRKNMAVMFVTKIENGEQKSEGLCLSCAKELGIKPINDFMDKLGITDEDMKSLNEQMSEIMNNPEAMESIKESLAGANAFDMLADFMPDSDDDEDDDESEDTAQTIIMRQSPYEQAGTGQESSASGKTTKTKEKKQDKKRKLLNTYGINLTAKAKGGEVDRIIGRDREIKRAIEILNRRNKNNPVLLGEPGVGKTAIAEGLADRIAKGQVPAKLLSYEVYLLDFTSIVAGTQFRGQFEQRLKGILEEAKKSGNIILVIDEIHNIVGAGDAEGAMSAANILKPALARGEIQILGATTLDDYRKHIEKDSALERRFQPVMVDEPSPSDTVEILKGIRDYYEKYHKVLISDEIIEKTVEMSERYITDRFLPDKAIDVIDEASSKANLANDKLVELTKLKDELRMIQIEKSKAVEEDSIENYQKAADLKVRECQITDRIAEIEKTPLEVALTVMDIAEVIETWTSIPVKNITELESVKLMKLEERIHERLIGQDEAVNAVSRAIRRNRAGLSKKKKPVSFIFVGPTGVGKTELVKTLAEIMFDSEEALIRVDMSEYMESHSVSKLIGSPPGYVGYDDAGQLTEKVRRKPYSIILLDEIEKAHPEVFNILLQILDDGRITDSHGKMVDFSNTVIIMTSNAGSDLKTGNFGFTNDENIGISNKVDGALKSIFRPEFLNRIDEIITFRMLTKPELMNILELMLKDLRDQLKSKYIDFEITDDAKNLLLDVGYDAKYGARPLRRSIATNIEDKIAEKLISGNVASGGKIIVCAKDGEIVIE